MNYIRRAAVYLVMGSALCAISTGTATACACSFWSTSLSMSQDQQHVYATATMTLSYLCQGTAEATVTAPDSTQAFNFTTQAGGGDPISTTASYTIGIKDGTYGGLGQYHYEGTDTGQGQGNYPQRTDNQTVAPFVQLIDTSFIGSPIAKVNGSGTFNATVITSINCSGTVGVAGNITHPNNMQIQIAANVPDGNGGFTGDTALGSFPFGSGQQHQFSYTVATGAANSIGNLGGVATGYVASYPPACTNITAVPAGHSASQNYLVGP